MDGGWLVKTRALDRLSAQLEYALLTVNEIRLESERQEHPNQLIEREKLQQIAVNAAIHFYQSRRARENLCPAENIFGEPAWDILLDLYIRQSHGETVNVRAAAIRCGASPATTLRWFSVLAKAGFVILDSEMSDNHQTIFRLSPEGYEKLTRYFITALA